MRIRLSLIFMIILSGCISNPPSSDGWTIPPNEYAASEVANRTKISKDQSRGLITYISPRIVHKINSGAANLYFLRAWRNLSSGKPSGYQLYISTKRERWIFLHSVFSDGKDMNAKVIDREVDQCRSSPCFVTESISVNLSSSQFNGLLKNGFVGVAAGKRGDVKINIPNTYVQGFANAFNRPFNDKNVGKGFSGLRVSDE